jgi:hypothetical protein
VTSSTKPASGNGGDIKGKIYGGEPGALIYVRMTVHEDMETVLIDLRRLWFTELMI